MTTVSTQFGLLFSLLTCITFFALTVNHIDDTDETYGYWDPLHYLLFGNGMQTWEYAPLYAIRTYSFLFPMYKFCSIIMRAAPDTSKLTLFKFVRSLLGLFSAYGQTSLINSVAVTFSGETGNYFALFLVLSPGMFYSSTSFLPSAVATTLIMLSCAACLRGWYHRSIVWGSIAVLWTGWPFVALVLVPLGIYMLYGTFTKLNKRGPDSLLSSTVNVLQLCVTGALLAGLVCLPAVLIDRHFYNKWTSPSLNILLYNAVGGSGDELYGVEPPSYYVRNLLLNLGLAWPIALVSPLVLATEVLLTRLVTGSWPLARKTESFWKAVLLFSLPVLWLGVLFARPHKEERFLYPVYPTLAFVAAVSVGSALRSVELITVCSTSHSKAGKQRQSSSLRGVLIGALVLLMSALFAGRIASNYVNYRGYMSLWTAAGDIISAASEADRQVAAGPRAVRVCTGSEWYLFPSHFFLPPAAQLAYVEDGFGGILPQPFPAVNGTSAEPLQPFNDGNREEVSRYVPVSSCDYLVLLVDRNKEEHTLGPLRRGLVTHGRPGSSATETSAPGAEFAAVASRDVISPEFSEASLARAFYIPGLSERAVKFKQYTLFRRQQKQG